MHGDERPEPVTIGWCVQPASTTPLKQPGGDDPRVTIRPVIFLKFFFVNRRTRRSFTRWALPSSVVSTAATNGVLPGLPRPPYRSAALPAEIGIVLSMRPSSGLPWLRSSITCLSLWCIALAVL